MNKIQFPVVISCAHPTCEVHEHTFMMTRSTDEYIKIVIDRIPGREDLFEVVPPKDWTHKYLQGWFCPKHKVIL